MNEIFLKETKRTMLPYHDIYTNFYANLSRFIKKFNLCRYVTKMCKFEKKIEMGSGNSIRMIVLFFL